MRLQSLLAQFVAMACGLCLVVVAHPAAAAANIAANVATADYRTADVHRNAFSPYLPAPAQDVPATGTFDVLANLGIGAAKPPACDQGPFYPCWAKFCDIRRPSRYCLQCPGKPDCCNQKKPPNVPTS